ncbi:MAG TPA: NAD(P)H-dependent oxidoreductase subunit E, partial [Bacillota bacterium]|nr:NAD(P)H-dependent oxidoreductase subunit E [Bacillota bacterium]
MSSMGKKMPSEVSNAALCETGFRQEEEGSSQVSAGSSQVSAAVRQQVAELVTNLGRSREMLIPILQAIQSRYLYLPEAAIDELAGLMELTSTTILGVATFYAQFRLQPAGRHRIKVCTGTACHLRGAAEIYDAFKTYLKIDNHFDTDPTGDFTVEKVACLGCCMLAPVVQIDQVTYGYVKPEMVPEIIGNFRNLKASFRNKRGFVSPTPPLNGLGEICICCCSSCQASGAVEVYQEIARQIKQFCLPVKVKPVGCLGQADRAPLLEVISGVAVSGESGSLRRLSYYYEKVRKQDVAEILLSHFQPVGFRGRSAAVGYRIFERWYTGASASLRDEPLGEIGINKSQTPLVTGERGRLDPLNLDEYIQSQGFAALRSCLEKLTPEMVIQTIAAAGLRGRGGAGFPTAEKWQKVRET